MLIRLFRKSVPFVIALACTVLAQAQAADAIATPTLTSPNGQLTMTFAIQKSPVGSSGSGKLAYSVTFKGKKIIEDSAFGLELEGQVPLGFNVIIAESTPGSGVDDYTLANTKVSKVHEAYNALSVRVVEGDARRPSRTMIVEARAYNDGLAFRYVLPANSGIRDLQLHSEQTEFRLSSDATVWALALPNYRSSYESEYVRLSASSLSNQGGVPSKFLIGLPMLIHQPGLGWMSLMEADLEGNSSMYVTNPTGSWAGHYFVAKLAPRFDTPEYATIATLPHHSAWRVLGVADDPGRLIESNLLTNLNPPSRVQDTSWIKPGKASWNWWVNDVDRNGKPAYTTENMKYYVDFAAESGFPYMLLDAGWSKANIAELNGRVDVPELVRYAATKNVKVWIWLYADAVMKQMKEAFPVYEKWGVAGVKIDFVNRDDQEGIQFYYDVAHYAAQHHLMVDFHGTRTPWGLIRTYPNVLTYEAVLGLENNKVGRRDSPVDRSVFAFTRLLAGPMDYTPGAFNNATEDGFVAQNTNPMAMGTRAQQLALYVIYESSFVMVSDSPQAYAGQPAFQFIKDVPTSWDSTRVLNGQPGEFITIARNHGSEWYLGSMTNWTPRTLKVPLNFLGAGSYTAEVYEDGPAAATEPKQVNIRKQVVTSTDTLTLQLAPGGGCAIRFVPRKGR